MAADLSHCNTPCSVSAFKGSEELEGALQGADLVVIPAGVGATINLSFVVHLSISILDHKCARRMSSIVHDENSAFN